MYYVYSDEAGTSRKEPVTVVVGVILHADRHWQAAHRMLQEIIDAHVPPDLRPGFIFHAKTIWAGYRTHDALWPRAKRLEFIGSIAAIPRNLGAAVALGKVRRDFKFPVDPRMMSLADFHHVMAFGRCMARANKYVRDWGAPGEIATVVAEDVPEKRRFLKTVLRAPPVDYPLTSLFVRESIQDHLVSHTGPVDRIVDTINFVEKGEAPLLQIADACAFSLDDTLPSKTAVPKW